MTEDMGFSSVPKRSDHCDCQWFPGWHFETFACKRRKREEARKTNEG